MSITVLLADDNLLVREGVSSLINATDDLVLTGVASDYDEVIAAAEGEAPQVLVTDIRMPPSFQKEGIDAAKVVRKMHPGTGIVILSQYEDPEYAVSLLSEGAAGYAYLLKDRVAEGDQLTRAIREVATGGSMLDPKIVEALTKPVTGDGSLTPEEEMLLDHVAKGTPIKAIAVAMRTTPTDVDARIEKLWVRLADGVSAGSSAAISRLKSLQRAISVREEQGQELSRLLPTGIADKLLSGGRRIGATEELEVTVLMSDIRGYSGIAERTDPTALAAQLNRHRAEMNHVILGNGGTVMQFVGDAVLALFGAPDPMRHHAELALATATGMHRAQARVNDDWERGGLDSFELGIGLSTGEVVAALLGSEERVEYSVVGDTVNLAQRLQEWADSGETVLSEPTWQSLPTKPDADELEPELVKGRTTPVRGYRTPRRR